MAIPSKEDIRAIQRKLKVELWDHALESQSGRIDLFFDTVDVRTAVLGMRQFVNDPGSVANVQIQQFNRDSTLIDCLLASGWLGTFRLLPPHQAEFLRHLKTNAAFLESPQITKEDFLIEIGLHVEDRGTRKRLRDMAPEESTAFIREQAGSARQLFKAYQCVGEHWGERLERWRRTGLFNTAPMDLDYSDLVKGSVFSSVLSSFEKSRSDQYQPGPKSRNNFADAVALSMLVELTKAFNEGRTRVVPRFFDATGLFERVARDAGIEKLLAISVLDGPASAVLVGAEYLLYKAIFRPAPPLAWHDKRDFRPALNLADLDHQLDRILGNGESEEALESLSDALNSIRVSDRTVGTIVNELLKLSFLENVWVDSILNDENDAANLVLHLTGTEEVASPEFKEQVLAVITDTTSSLEKNTNEYRQLSQAWIKLKNGIIELRIRSRQMLGLERPFNVIRDLELVRFGLPGSISERVTKIMSALMSDEVSAEEITQQAEWHELIKAYTNKSRTSTNALVSGSILWTTRSYRSVIDLLEAHIDREDQISVKLLYAAACFAGQTPEKVKHGESVLQRLIGRYQEEPRDNPEDLERSAAMASGIAYLCFHLARLKGYRAAWKRSDSGESRVDELLVLAIQFAANAVKDFGRLAVAVELDLDLQMRRAYALNQHLYYLVEQGLADHWSEMQSDARELQELEHVTPEVWQYTFDDTLARYLHFSAVRSKDFDSWQSLMKQAIELEEKAKNNAPWDALVRNYLTQLSVERGRGPNA